LIDPATVDGLVVNSVAMLPWVDSITGLKALLARCHPLPAISIALEVEGIPNSGIQGEMGMGLAITYLIEVHGCRRVAFIPGAAGNSEAQYRYQAYLDVLRAYNIPFDPDLVASPDYIGMNLQDGTLCVFYSINAASPSRPSRLLTISSYGLSRTETKFFIDLVLPNQTPVERVKLLSKACQAKLTGFS
jgi:DNA-binding LacI/PurR family transcriptional regulator